MLLFLIVLASCVMPVSATSETATLPADGDIVAAFEATTAMLTAIFNVLRSIETRQRAADAYFPCQSGRGFYSTSGLWRPRAVHDVYWIRQEDANVDQAAAQPSEAVNGEDQVQYSDFVLGATSHEVTGHRQPTPVSAEHGAVHAAKFLGKIAVGAHEMLCTLAARHSIEGAPTLKSGCERCRGASALDYLRGWHCRS